MPSSTTMSPIPPFKGGSISHDVFVGREEDVELATLVYCFSGSGGGARLSSCPASFVYNDANSFWASFLADGGPL